MTNQQLLDYIVGQRSRGVSDSDIRNALLSAGWQTADVEEGLKQWGGHSAPPPPFAGPEAPVGSDGTAALLNVGQLLKMAADTFKQRFKPVILVTLLGIAHGLMVIAPAGILVWLSIYKFPGTIGILVAAIAGLIGFVWYIYIILRLQIAIYTVVAGTGDVSLKELWRATPERAKSMLWIGVLSQLVIAGGLLLLIIPGIIVGLAISFSIWVFVLEGLKGRDALVRSRSYVKGRWGKIFWRLFVLGIIGIAFYGIFAILIYLTGEEGLVPGIISGIEVVFSILWSLFALCYAYHLYVSAKSTAVIDPAQEAKAKKKYTILAWLGPLILLLIPVAVVSLSLGSAREKARDARRLADVRQVMTALELYANDEDAYPQTLSNLVPEYFSNSSLIPIAPTPADGACTDEQNQYSYEFMGDGSYELSFCLSESYGGYNAGVNTVEGTPLIQETSEITEWETFSNFAYGYDIDLPASWKAYDIFDQSVIANNPSEFPQSSIINSKVYIIFEGDIDMADIEKRIKAFQQSGEVIGDVPTPVSASTGEIGSKYHGLSTGDFVHFFYKGGVLEIQARDVDPSVFDQIISSIKFFE